MGPLLYPGSPEVPQCGFLSFGSYSTTGFPNSDMFLFRTGSNVGTRRLTDSQKQFIVQ